MHNDFMTIDGQCHRYDLFVCLLILYVPQFEFSANILRKTLDRIRIDSFRCFDNNAFDLFLLLIDAKRKSTFLACDTSCKEVLSYTIILSNMSLSKSVFIRFCILHSWLKLSSVLK